MNVLVAQGNILEHDADLVVVNLFDGVTAPEGATGAVDRALNGQISDIISAGDFEGKLNETLYLYTQGAIPARRILLIGLGKQDDFTLDHARPGGGESSTHGTRPWRETGCQYRAWGRYRRT